MNLELGALADVMWDHGISRVQFPSGLVVELKERRPAQPLETKAQTADNDAVKKEKERRIYGAAG